MARDYLCATLLGFLTCAVYAVYKVYAMELGCHQVVTLSIRGNDSQYESRRMQHLFDTMTLFDGNGGALRIST